MNQLRITDNHDWTSEFLSGSPIDKDWENLSLIANASISSLSKETHPNLLVFPHDLYQCNDKIGDLPIIGLRSQQISTGNMMGFVGVNDTQLNICSRFAKEDGQDYFLHYMLHKVFSINLFNLKHTKSREPIFDFLLYLFPYFLKKALVQGLFKKYQRFEHNDANVKGPIAVNRHIRENVPFRGTISYNTREHSYDNEVTQLVRHTIEFIRRKELGSTILTCDTETQSFVNQIIIATPSYQIQQRTKVLNANLRPIRHPYYSEYTALQRLCVQILRYEGLKFGDDKDKIYGVLFDGAWLWEEYLNTILRKLNFCHPENKNGKGGISMFENTDNDDINRNSRRTYPDFYYKDKNDFKIILDAKYKHLEKGVGREDLYQVVTYMYCTKAIRGGYLFPSEGELEPTKYELKGYGGTISLLPFYIPQEAQSFADFGKKISNSEKKLSDWVKNVKC